MATNKSDSKSMFVPLSNVRDASRVRAGTLPIGLILALVLVFFPLSLTYSLATTNEYVVVATFLMFVTALVILKWPFVGLNLLVLILYVRPEENIEEIRGFRLFFVVSLLTLFSLLIKHFIEGIPLRRNPTMYGVVLFSLFVVLSAATNGTFSIALVDMSNIIAFMFIILDQIDSEKRFKSTIRSLIYCTLFISVYSIYLFNSGAFLDQHGVFRSIATGIFSDPNDLASAIVPGFALSLSYVNKKNLFSMWNFIISGVCLYAIVLTSSRGAMLGLFSVFMTFIVINGNLKKMIAPSVILMAVIFVLAPTRMMNIDSGEEAANSRLLFWINGIYYFIKNPLLGIGYSGFADINDGFTAHNSFVLCFTEIGFIGYLFWMSCVYFAYKSLLINKKYSRECSDGMLMALNGFLTCCFFLSRTYNLVLMMILGISSSYVASGGVGDVMGLFSKKDLYRILMLSVFSIIFIYLVARFAS